MNYSEVANLFVKEFPQYKHDLEIHIQEFDEILAYVFFTNIFKDHISDLLKKNTEKNTIIKLFDFFERMAKSENEDIQALLSLTILDYMRDEPVVLEVGKSYCGAYTTLLLNDILRFYGLIPKLEKNRTTKLKKKNKKTKIKGGSSYKFYKSYSK